MNNPLYYFQVRLRYHDTRNCHLDYHCVYAIEIRGMIDLSHTQVAKTSAEKLYLGEDFKRHFSFSLLYHAEAHTITYYSLKLHTLNEADCLVQAD